jgi:hypothetical protein
MPVGWTVKEKLLPANTVVGEGLTQMASREGLVAGYRKVFDEMAGTVPISDTVKESAPGAAKRSGKAKIIVVEFLKSAIVTGI